MRHRVDFVHLLAELRAPLGHGDGEADVEDQGEDRDACEPDVELDGQDGEHHRDLDQRRHDAVERVRNQRVHGTRAALDVARHAAGLALEVEAQAQRMQVTEDLQRDAACRAFCGLGEDQLAQFGEEGGRQAQAAVGEQQAHRHHDHRGGVAWLDVHGVDQRLQQHRHTDVGDLGPDEEGQRDGDAPAVAPQVGQQAAQRGPVGARLDRACLGSRDWQRGAVVSHERMK